MPKVKREKYYLIVSKENKYIHGAFPYSKKGRELAKAYIDKNSTKENKLILKIK